MRFSYLTSSIIINFSCKGCVQNTSDFTNISEHLWKCVTLNIPIVLSVAFFRIFFLAGNTRLRFWGKQILVLAPGTNHPNYGSDCHWWNALLKTQVTSAHSSGENDYHSLKNNQQVSKLNRVLCNCISFFVVTWLFIYYLHHVAVVAGGKWFVCDWNIFFTEPSWISLQSMLHLLKTVVNRLALFCWRRLENAVSNKCYKLPCFRRATM